MPTLNETQLSQVEEFASLLLVHFEPQALAQIFQVKVNDKLQAKQPETLKYLVRRTYEAGQLKRIVVAISKMRHKPPETLAALDSLSNVLTMAGYTEWSEHLTKQLIQLSKQFYGETHIKVGFVLANLAANYTLQERYEEAFEISNQALALIESQAITIYEKQKWIYYLKNHSELLNRMGDAQEGFDTLVSAIHVSEDTFGQSHPQTFQLLQEAGIILHNGRDYFNSLDCMERAFLGHYFNLGLSHPQTMGCFEDFLRIAQSTARITNDNAFVNRYQHYFDHYYTLQQQ